MTRDRSTTSFAEEPVGSVEQEPPLAEAGREVGESAAHLVERATDVGFQRADAGKTRVAGDVHPDVAAVAAWISPNPGGVGPMTRAMLLANVVDAAEAS